MGSSGYFPYLAPEEVRAELWRIVGDTASGLPLPKEGRFRLRGDGDGGSCMHHTTERGVSLVGHAILSRLFLGNARALDWAEIFISLLAHYSMWDDGTPVLDAAAVYDYLLWIWDGDLPSSTEMASKTRVFLAGLAVVPLRRGPWSGDERVVEHARRHSAYCNRCMP